MKKKLKRIGRTQRFMTPDVINRIFNIKEIDINGIFFDGKYYIACFKVAVDNMMSFESLYVNLRKKNISYRVTFFKGVYIFSFYVQSKDFSMAEKQFTSIINEVLFIESVTVHQLNMNDLFEEVFDYFKIESPKKNGWIRENFAKLFQIKDIDFQKSFVKKGDNYLRMYQIIDINTGYGNSENMYENIMRLPGIKCIVSDFDSVEDKYVVATMKKLYLDIDNVVAKIRLQNPDLYNAYISTDTQTDETYSFILAGLTLMLEANTLDKLDEYSKLLFECSKKNSFEVLKLEDMQKDTYMNLSLLSGYSKNIRMYGIDEGIDFLPYLYATK